MSKSTISSYIKKLAPGIKSAVLSTLVAGPVILFFWSKSVLYISYLEHSLLSVVTLSLLLLGIYLSSYTVLLKIQSLKDIKFINKHYPDRKDEEEYDEGWDDADER